MSVTLRSYGRFFPRLLPGPVRTAEQRADDSQHDSNHETHRKDRIRDETLAGKPAPDPSAFAVDIRQQDEGRNQYPRYHDAAPKRGVTDQFLQAEKVPRRFRRVGGMNRVRQFFQWRILEYGQE